VFPGPVPCEYPSSRGPSGEGRGTAHDSISHVRPYAPGDPLSSVAWKKARQGLVSRVMQGGGSVGSVVVLHPGGDLEEKLGKATFLVGELMRSGVSFGLAVNGFFSGMGTSVEHKLQILTELALVQSLGAPRHRGFPEDAHVVHL